tara:strand:+ start:93 stop:1061 length:969 start_codon:yes stop_codon:yes gene_type:complete
LNRKSALVLGCSGQDGILLCRSLSKQGYEVIGGSRNKEKTLQKFKEEDILSKVAIHHIDINNFDSIFNAIKEFSPNEIYNFAGQSSVSYSFEKPNETLASIVLGTSNILEASKKINFQGKIFFAGSGEIYGETEKGADINYSKNPKSPYGIGKQASLELVRIYREVYGLNAVTGILFNHESELRDQKFVTHKIINGAINISKNKNSIIHLGNINISRDWGYAKEYVEAMQCMLRTDILKDQLICTGKLTSLKEFIEITFKYLNLNWEQHIKISKKHFRPQEIKRNYGNPKQIYKDLGWRAKLDIKSLIHKLINKKIKEEEKN